MSFLNEKTAQQIQQNDQTAVFKNIPPEDTARNLACYNGESINPKGRLVVMIESEGWKIQTAPFIIVDNHKAIIIGRNILPRIGIKFIQDKQTHRVLTVQRSDESNHEIKQWVKVIFQQLCVRIGKSKYHVMKTQFSKKFAVQQKGRRIPIHLQQRVEAELNKLIDHKHIVKLDKRSDKQFISPSVITVKKDQTVKLALDSKKINKYIHKNKYQMPNLDLLPDNIAQVVKSDKSNQTLFTTLDLRYAYSQIELDKTTREQCNFSLIGGNATGTTQFQTGFYGLRDMPAEFQKAVELTLTNCNNTYAYLDDILIVTKGTIETHRQKLQKVLTKLEENLAISLDKCKFACKQIEWLGFTINSEGTKPLMKKTEAIEKLSPSKTFNQLKSFMGSTHHLTRYIPNLAQAVAALRPLLKNTEKNRHSNWLPEHNFSAGS